MNNLAVPSLDEIRTMLAFIPPTSDREEWISVFHAVASAYPKSQEGFAICQDWARGFEGRNEKTDSKHEYNEYFSDNHKANIGALIAKAKRNGYTKSFSKTKDYTSYTVTSSASDEKNTENSRTVLDEVRKTASSVIQCLLMSCTNTEIINFFSSNHNTFKYYPKEFQAILTAIEIYIKHHSAFSYTDFTSWLNLNQESEINAAFIDKIFNDDFERISPALLDNFHSLSVNYGKCIISTFETRRLAALAMAASTTNVNTIVNRVISGLTNLQIDLDSQNDRAISTPAEAVSMISNYEEILKNPERRSEIFIPFGHKALDAVVCGMPRGEVTLFSAFSGQGKTWFAVDLTNRLLSKNFSVGFVSAEMADQAIWHRLFCNIEQVGPAQSTKYHLDRFTSFMAQKRLEILAKRGLSIKDIENFVVKMFYSGGIDVLLIDYFQLIDLSYGNSWEKWERLKKVMERLITLALKYNIAIFSLSQLTQQQKNSKKEPSMYDIAGSTQIIHDVALSLFLYTLDNVEYLKVSKSRYQSAGDLFVVSRSTGSVFTLNPTMKHNYSNNSSKRNGLWG